MSPTDETAPRETAPSTPSSDDRSREKPELPELSERPAEESDPSPDEGAGENGAETEAESEAASREGSSEGASIAAAGTGEETPREEAAPETNEEKTSERGASPAAAEPIAPPEPEGEIVLDEGKTLSDYLEDEPSTPAGRAQDPGAFRSVPNVEKLVVPPPGGVRARTGEAGAQSEEPRRAGSEEAQGKRSRGDRGRAPEGDAGRERPRDGRGDRRGDRPAGARPSLPGGPQRDSGASRGAAPASKIRPVTTSADASEAPGDREEFQAMLESSLGARAFEDGETVRGTIVAIGPDVAFLDIGGKSEATIDLEELKDPEGDIEVDAGDVIEAIVVSTEGGLKLSRKMAMGAAAKGQLADAFRAGLPVEGRVEKTIKGGYEVRIAGQRAFCPFSQIDVVRANEPAAHEGRVYTFRIIEFKEGGRNLVVSRRALLKEEEKQKAEETKKSIVPGAVLKGRVVSVREYGAFVDLGGVQGLVHVSEMGWARVATPAEVVKPGDEVEVKVLKVDEEKGKISLGMKQLMADPWSKVAETYKVGEVRQGKIVRLQDFGAFVELEPGIEGLAHASTFAPTGTQDGWKKAAPPGTTGEFEILTIDPARKRIGVAYLGDGSWRAARAAQAEEAARAREAGADGRTGSGADAAAPGAARPASGPPKRAEIRVGDRITGKVERHEVFGVFVYLGPGRTGLLPAAESATQRGADLKKIFPIGSEVEVLVLDIDPAGRKIRLSRKALLDIEEKTDAREFASRQQVKESFGSIGEKLRAALASRQK